MYINDKPELTLIYFTARSNLDKMAYCSYKYVYTIQFVESSSNPLQVLSF